MNLVCCTYGCTSHSVHSCKTDSHTGLHNMSLHTHICPTHPAVQSIRRHIDAFLIAAIGPSAPFSATNPRVLIASNQGLRLPLSEKAAHAPTNVGLELEQRNVVGGGRQLFISSNGCYCEICGQGHEYCYNG